MISVFILWFLLAEALLFAIAIPFRKKKFKTRPCVVLIAVKTLLSIAFAVLVLAGPIQLRPLQPFMSALYAALFTAAIADAVYLIICAIRKHEIKFLLQKALSLLFGALFLTYGIVNMETVTAKKHVYTSDKLTSEHRFVYLADLHVGSAQPFSVTEKTVSDIVSQNPEFIVLCGDITDDYTTKSEMQETFRLFGSCGIPVYYVYGNHDRQRHAEYANGVQYTPEEFEQAIESNGIVILKDSFVQISPDLVLMGREDISEGENRAAADSLSNPWPDSYLIVADHQPVEFEKNLVLGTDLQISGHTHAGQFFPLRFFYSVIGKCYGDYEKNGAIMNVSSGACGWRVPFRTDAHCNYEVITLVPNK